MQRQTRKEARAGKKHIKGRQDMTQTLARKASEEGKIVDTVNTKAKQYQECENAYHENRS